MQTLMPPFTVSRRQALLKLAAAGVIAAVPQQFARSAAASGAQAPHLDVKDPAAVAVAYTENAEKVDAKKYPSYSPGSACENCLQLQGASGAAYRPCTLFVGKLVATAGWCSAWTAEI